MSGLSVRYEPSATREWLFAIAPGRILAVSSALPEARRAAVWEALGARSPITTILDRVVGGSLTDAPDFTLVGWDDEPEGGVAVHVFSRGPLGASVATAEGIEQIDSGGVTTWAERRVSGVLGVAVGKAFDPAEGLPLLHGMVFASGCTAGAVGISRSAAASRVAPAAQVAPPPPRARALEDTIAAPIDDPPRPEDAGPSEAVAPPGPRAVSVPPAPTGEDGDGGGAYDHLFGATVSRPLEEAAVRPKAVEAEEDVSEPPRALAAPPSLDDSSEQTIVTKDLDALRAMRRKDRAAPVVEAGPPTHFLEASDGHREAIDGTLLLGRAPVVTRVSGGAVPRLIKVTTPNQELSRTHVEVKVEGGAVVVTDLHSKNGTLVTAPGRAPQQLRAGEPTTVLPGSTIDLGDTAVFTVGEE